MKKGFTIAELMVVTIIISVLMALALPNLSNIVEKSKSGEGLQILEALRKAQWTYYYENNNAFATLLSDLDVDIQLPTEHFDQITISDDTPEPIAEIRRIGSLYTLGIDSDGTINCYNEGIPGICKKIGL